MSYFPSLYLCSISVIISSISSSNPFTDSFILAVLFFYLPGALSWSPVTLLWSILFLPVITTWCYLFKNIYYSLFGWPFSLHHLFSSSSFYCSSFLLLYSYLGPLHIKVSLKTDDPWVSTFMWEGHTKKFKSSMCMSRTWLLDGFSKKWSCS